MLRDLAGVIAGFIVMAILVMVTTPIAMMMFMRGGTRNAMQGKIQVPPGGMPRAYLVANLLFGVLSAIVGGWVAVWIGQSAKWPIVGLIVLLLAMSRVSHVMTKRSGAKGQPTWYPVAMAVMGVIGILIGGWLKAR